MQALISESQKLLEMVEGNNLRDAALIASAQKVEHYEIAAYGTAAAPAGQLNREHARQPGALAHCIFYTAHFCSQILGTSLSMGRPKFRFAPH
jgi:hypothetical protein